MFGLSGSGLVEVLDMLCCSRAGMLKEGFRSLQPAGTHSLHKRTGASETSLANRPGSRGFRV